MRANITRYYKYDSNANTECILMEYVSQRKNLYKKMNFQMSSENDGHVVLPLMC